MRERETTIQQEKETRGLTEGREGGRQGWRGTQKPLSASHCSHRLVVVVRVRPSPFLPPSLSKRQESAVNVKMVCIDRLVRLVSE